MQQPSERPLDALTAAREELRDIIRRESEIAEQQLAAVADIARIVGRAEDARWARRSRMRGQSAPGEVVRSAVVATLMAAAGIDESAASELTMLALLRYPEVLPGVERRV